MKNNLKNNKFNFLILLFKNMKQQFKKKFKDKKENQNHKNQEILKNKYDLYNIRNLNIISLNS